MQNGLAPHLHMVVETQEGYLGCRGSLQRSEGSQPHIQLPNPEHQFQEEEPPQNPIVKMRVYLITN